MAHLTEQELHNLAMNIVGERLEAEGFEFLGINSQLKRDPQFVALKEGKLNFIIVRAIEYPNDPKKFDVSGFQKIKEHAAKYNARTFYAGVGLANETDYEMPLTKDSDFIINYDGTQEI